VASHPDEEDECQSLKETASQRKSTRKLYVTGGRERHGDKAAGNIIEKSKRESLDATIEMSSVKKLGNRCVRVEMQKGAERASVAQIN